MATNGQKKRESDETKDGWIRGKIRTGNGKRSGNYSGEVEKEKQKSKREEEMINKMQG